MRRGLLALIALSSPLAAHAATDYGLQAQPVAQGVFAFIGRSEEFNRENGGNIVNTGFIIGADGVIVIDTGPSRLYGEQQRSAIARTTNLPVRQAYLTHAHPDHFLGNQAYAPQLIAALPATVAAVQQNGEALSQNLYRLVGGAMIGTEVVLPQALAAVGSVDSAGRKLLLIAASGHTDGDLMVYDVATKTLFSGDLVFFQRAPTTPNADIVRWLAALEAIDKLDITAIVPGHGPVIRGRAGIDQTRDYLQWLNTVLHDAANRGLDMVEVMHLPIPERFRSLAVVDAEYTRSVVHLYPPIELEALPAAAALPPRTP